MKVVHKILALPEQNEEMDTIISNEDHDVRNVSFSSVMVENKPKHFVLLIWHDKTYGDEMF